MLRIVMNGWSERRAAGGENKARSLLSIFLGRRRIQHLDLIPDTLTTSMPMHDPYRLCARAIFGQCPGPASRLSTTAPGTTFSENLHEAEEAWDVFLSEQRPANRRHDIKPFKPRRTGYDLSALRRALRQRWVSSMAS
jgi:hypothetical protein